MFVCGSVLFLFFCPLCEWLGSVTVDVPMCPDLTAKGRRGKATSNAFLHEKLTDSALLGLTGNYAVVVDGWGDLCDLLLFFFVRLHLASIGSTNRNQ
jgi:hypothetical protein